MITLYDLPTGELSTVQHIPDDNADLLRHVAELGLLPNVELVVREHDPQDGSVQVVVRHGQSGDADASRRVARDVASRVFVSRPKVLELPDTTQA